MKRKTEREKFEEWAREWFRMTRCIATAADAWFAAKRQAKRQSARERRR